MKTTLSDHRTSFSLAYKAGTNSFICRKFVKNVEQGRQHLDGFLFAGLILPRRDRNERFFVARIRATCG